MRHSVYGKHLGRNKNERTALFKSLVQDLLIHSSIETTETKAKAVKGLVDKIINQAKSKESRRLLQSFLTNKSLREKLIKEVVPNLKDRNSGYTSVVKLGLRKGDNAMMVRMSLLTEEVKVKSEESKNVMLEGAKRPIASKQKKDSIAPPLAGLQNDKSSRRLSTPKTAVKKTTRSKK